VFDLDGTLVDSRRDLADAANALLAERGCPPLAEEAIGRMVGEGAATLVSRVFAASGRPVPPGALARFLALYDERLLASTRPYPGVPVVLESLSARMRLAVLTNKPLASTRRILAGLDLERFFPAAQVLGGDGPHPRKPDPQGLRHLAAGAGAAPSDVMLVGDSLIDWQTARAAGVPACVARYGFGFEERLAAALGPDDRVVDHPIGLLAFL
jgi:phosphoglycolate phosphatase